MSYELYWFSGSGPAWRALLTLEVKGLPYESKLMAASKGDHKTPEFLALNPRGKVPVLKDGDVVVCQSSAIMTYLDQKHPEVSLFGKTPVEAARIVHAIEEMRQYLEEPLGQLVRIVFRGKVAERADEAREFAKTAFEELDKIEATLATRPFLVDDNIRAPDVILLPGIQSLVRAAGKPDAAALDLGITPLDGRFPHLAKWVARFEALPGYDKTFPPHWR